MHISPLFWAIERLFPCKTVKVMSCWDGIPWGCPRPAEFSLRFFKSDRLLAKFYSGSIGDELTAIVLESSEIALKNVTAQPTPEGITRPLLARALGHLLSNTPVGRKARRSNQAQPGNTKRVPMNSRYRLISAPMPVFHSSEPPGGSAVERCLTEPRSAPCPARQRIWRPAPR